MDKSIGNQETLGGAKLDDSSKFNMPTKANMGRQPSKRFQIGEVILGRYKILSELGQGGMGVVYRCFDDVSGIEVALKALPPEVARNSGEMEEVRENFRLVSKLHHPNIANVNTLERDGVTGDYYLIMECVDGYDIRQWARRRRDGGKPLTLEEISIIAYRLAEALDYAHGQKIIHRDIKPSNVRVSFEGEVKVLDFGLAAQIHTSMSRVSMASNGTSGTGPYMAPEQWRGLRQGPAADQYALAATVYELLGGEPPFVNHDTSILREVVLKEPVQPIADLPAQVNSALLKALAKDPAQRFANCKEFVASLSGQGSGFRVRGSGGSKTWLWLAGAAIVVAVSILSIVAIGAYTAKPAVEKQVVKIDALQQGNAAAFEAETTNRYENASAKLDLSRRGAEARRREADKAKSEADQAKSATDAADLYADGGRGCARATEAFEKGEFEAADKAWQEATRTYVSAKKCAEEKREREEKEHQEKMKVALVAAQKAKGNGEWQRCLAFAEEALALEQGNAEALALKAEAEKHLTPSPSPPEEKPPRTVEWLGMSLIPVEAGSFQMGSDAGDADEKPVHTVRITRSYWIGKTEVTQKQWREVMGDSPGKFKGEDLPVESVNWDGCMEFCRKLTDRERKEGRLPEGFAYRLPTEAEWEYAARGGTKSRGYTYSGGNDIALVAWYSGNSGTTTHPVAQKLANELGLYDMSGNVFEWCLDWIGLYSEGNATDPSGAGTGSNRVVRGGSGGMGVAFCRSACRARFGPSGASNNLGFRVVLAPDLSDKRLEPDVVKVAGPVDGQAWKSPSTEMEFVWIDALKIWVGKYEVTNGEYRKKVPLHDSKRILSLTLNGDRQPVVEVSFENGKLFAEWMTKQEKDQLGGLRYRHPSESEWQIFAQCGDNRLYPWGTQWPPPKYGNYHGQEGSGTWVKIRGYTDKNAVACPVEMSGKNEWGLYGVGGNVWEACAANESGSSFGAFRGGSWVSNLQSTMKCTYRLEDIDSTLNFSYGFRLVLSR